MADDLNPWSNAGWNATAQSTYFQKHGQARSEARARDAGTRLGAARQSDKQPPVKIYILRGPPGKDGKAGTSGTAANRPILGFTAEGPFIASERFMLAPTPTAMQFPAASALLSSATCLFAPIADSSFVLTNNLDEFLATGDGVICTVTFYAGSQIGAFTWGDPITLPQSSQLFVVAPAVADVVLAGVQILFRGDPS